MDNIVCRRCSVSQTIQFRRFILKKGIFFHHLKLEIVLAIPALNEWKKEKKQYSNIRVNTYSAGSTLVIRIWRLKKTSDSDD